MSVPQIARHLDRKPNSVAKRLARGMRPRDANDASVRHEAVLDCWAEGASAKAIARTLSITPIAVSGIIARARVAGDPRAVRRYRERNAR